MWEENREVCLTHIAKGGFQRKGLRIFQWSRYHHHRRFFTISLPLEILHSTFSTFISTADFNVQHNEFFRMVVARMSSISLCTRIESRTARGKRECWWARISENRENDIWISERFPIWNLRKICLVAIRSENYTINSSYLFFHKILWIY